MDEILTPVATAMQVVQTAAAEAASAIVADADEGKGDPFWAIAAERVLTAAIVRAAADGQLNLPRVREVLRGYHEPDADIGLADIGLDSRLRASVLVTVEVVLRARAA